ncbi:energy-coupling factor transporter ATPase [Methanoregula sp.]|uniref:ABC transporter ATP-binding protein n=1 Tax=Methanoregula sp. TaxID=2052170 RepID=UPI002CDB0C0D|nr:energy-coupling factor transporter ATPase [Methanoregula sp.]HVP96123.1 energy-coupling factor transporter ATPase [Methanoregula sp.]
MIELSDVSYTYPHTVQEALHRLSLVLPRGRCILVTGPSGAGKTTLCLAACGILAHEYGGKKAGIVTINGKSVADYPGLSAIARTIGIVFDDAEAQMIFTTVEEEILSALEYRGLSPEEIEKRLTEILDVTYLSALKDRSPHHLSGGQKQRVALAATLALGNEVLILDEPTSELDEHATRRIVAILKNLKEQGKTLLIVEHKFSHFREIVDTLVVMERGAISAIGIPDEVLKNDRIREMVIPDFSGIRNGPATALPAGTAVPAIDVRHLSYSYGSVPALHDVNLNIAPGEFVAIVGENGSGKTTLVRQFNRLLTPTAGDVLILGKNTKDCTIAELARDVGLVFQNPDHMFFADTVRDEIAFGLANLGMENRDAIIDAALTEAGLLQAKALYPRWLSRGERQRLAIACVVAMQPKIIVLDEPTTGLDGDEARLVMEILKNHQQRGHTVVVITHNKEIARDCADRVITMDQGRVGSDMRAGCAE